MQRIFQVVTVGVLIALASVSINAKDPLAFPEVKTEDLIGAKAVFPADFPGDPTLVLVAFERKQQEDIDRWVTALSLKDDVSIPWIEMPTVARRYRLMKPLLDGWMRDGIPAIADQQRVFPVYTRRKSFLSALGVTKSDTVLAVVARPNGQICAIVEGLPTPDAIERIRGAMGLVTPGGADTGTFS
ncbi:MAG: hypothetical protein ACFBZ9_17575 [Sphingomonadales bacterium]